MKLFYVLTSCLALVAGSYVASYLYLIPISLGPNTSGDNLKSHLASSIGGTWSATPRMSIRSVGIGPNACDYLKLEYFWTDCMNVRVDVALLPQGHAEVVMNERIDWLIDQIKQLCPPSSTTQRENDPPQSQRYICTTGSKDSLRIRLTVWNVVIDERPAPSWLTYWRIQAESQMLELTFNGRK